MRVNHSCFRDHLSLFSNATFSKFLKPQTQANLLLVGEREAAPAGKEDGECGGGDLTTIDEVEEDGDDEESLAGSQTGVEAGPPAAFSTWEDVVSSTTNVDFLKNFPHNLGIFTPATPHSPIILSWSPQ